MLGVVLVACNRKEEPEVIEQPETPVTYTLSIQANKSDETKGLSLIGNTLNAIWAVDDVVYVFNQNGDQLTSMRPLNNAQINTSTCTLVGSFPSGNIPSADQVLTLKFNATNYNNQEGTISFIASHDDYAEATVTVKDVVIDGTEGYITIKEAYADFANQQAIVKFTLLKKDGTALPYNPTALTINDGTSDVATVTTVSSTYTTNGDGVLYVAVPAIDSKTITLTATVGSDTYIYEKSGVTFQNGKYYTRTVKMNRKVNLSEVTNFTAQNGDMLTGTLGSNVKISIAAGAAVTLNGARINAVGTWTTGNYAGLTCEGDATIILKDGTTNAIHGFHEDYPGIYVPSGSTLIIKGETAGTGELYASSNDDKNNSGAGIGGGWDLACGNIEIQGGVITATGSTSAAGIGSNNKACGDITISGGTVTATGTGYAAGIGGGFNGGCGNITIASTVTRVTAIAGLGATHSIGIGREGSIGLITIGGVVIGPISTSPYVYPAPATGFALSASTVGMIVGSDGLAYNVADKNNLPPGVTAVAMVAYKDGSNGLAIQLNASPSLMDYDAASSYTGYPAVSGGLATWRLPSKDDWQNMFVGCAKSGDADKDNYMNPIAGFKEKINATGVEFYSNGYWSPYDSSSWAVDVNLDDTYATASFSWTLGYYSKYVLGCLAF